MILFNSFVNVFYELENVTINDKCSMCETTNEINWFQVNCPDFVTFLFFSFACDKAIKDVKSNKMSIKVIQTYKFFAHIECENAYQINRICR